MNKDLEKKILEVADLIYATGYTTGSSESGFDAGYRYGLKAAWEAARKLIHDASNNYDMIDEMFGDCSVEYIIINDSAEDVLSKIKAYEEKPKQPEKKCEDCKNLFTDGYSTVCLIRKAACCINKDKWVPKQTEEQPKHSCENCINENTCSLKCPEHVKANGCRSWAPKQTNDQIKLGDEVIHTTGSKGIVVGIDSEYFYLLTSDYGVPQEVSKEGYTKTGRYFPQIQELRDQLH